MNEIIRYNEVDCRVIMEIVRYLRMNHQWPMAEVGNFKLTVQKPAIAV